MNGWLFAFGQNLILLAVAALLGVLVGVLFARARASQASQVSQAATLDPSASADTDSPADPGSERANDLADEPNSLGQLREELASAQAQVDDLNAQIQEAEGHAAVEYGRLEAAALRALDETISADEQRIAQLRAELAQAQEARADADRHLMVSEARHESMRSAIAERDCRIADLDTEVKALRKVASAAHVREGQR